MADYIDRQAALDALCDGTFEDAEMSIRSIPSADVAPVVHGKWIFNDDWWEFRCAECNKPIGNIKKYNYCPNCGAKMDL